MFWLPLLDLWGGLRINSPSKRLRCPAEAAPGTAGLLLADRCTRCAPALSATGSAGARSYLLSPLSRYRDGQYLQIVGQMHPKSQKETTPNWCGSFLAPPVGLEPTTCGLTVRRSTD